jgi:gluconate 2-dehydrogenase gamma chain
MSDDSTSLDDAQTAILTAIVERLIPSDEHGPGAREAHAARYILTALAGDYRRHLLEYTAGLASMDALAIAAYAAPFVSLEPTRQDALLAEVENSQRAFFDLVLKHTREGVFGDPRWGGNADRVGWRLIGYRGPQPAWTEEDQRIEVIEPRLQSPP